MCLRCFFVYRIRLKGIMTSKENPDKNPLLAEVVGVEKLFKPEEV